MTGTSNKTIYMGYSFNPKTGVKATDNAAGNLTSKIKVSGKVNTKKVGKYKITYIVTDKAKNTSKITRTITVKKDTTKPNITGALNKTIYMGYSFNPKTSVKAIDNVDGNITSKIKVSGKFNVNEVGIYKLKYSVVDKTKNKTTVTRIITVKKDTEKPKITGASNKTINYGDSFNPKKGVKATDNIDGTITSLMKIKGTVKTKQVGTYKLTYTVKDKTGNQTIVIRKVHVVDKVSPILTGISDLTISAGGTFNPLAGIKANDAADGNLTANIKVEGKINLNKPGTYHLTYTVRDKSGNLTTANRRVKVVDRTAPVISGAETKMLQMFDTFDPMEGVRATDNCDGDLTSKIELEFDGFVDTTSVGSSWVLIYTVTDEAQNTAVMERWVEVTHRKAIVEGLKDVIISLGESFDPFEGVKATDKATGKDILSYLVVDSEVYRKIIEDNKAGTYSLEYWLRDDKGYSDRFTRKVTVVDNGLPKGKERRAIKSTVSS
nr:immunoglobulin-like domain-containing protein [Pradoshia eiseniae]